MKSLEQLRRQLDSLGDLHSIVKTMKALSAASLKQYERAAAALEGYESTVRKGLFVVLAAGESAEPKPTHGPRRVASVVFGSDHGLCGRFNEAIAEHAIAHARSLGALEESPIWLFVGARVAAKFGHDEHGSGDILLVPSSAAQITTTVHQVLLKMDEWTEHMDVQEIHLYYNRHLAGRGYDPTHVRLLPVDLSSIPKAERWASRSLPTFSMDREMLLSRLLRQYLFVAVFRACAESLKSEHTSRLSAMQAAERNLDERSQEVTQSHRRARQRAITAELLDVVSGFEASTAIRSS